MLTSEVIDMCGRYNVAAEQAEDIKRMIQEINEKLYGQQVKTGEIRPTDLAAVLTPHQGNSALTAMTWGFPHFKGSGVIINARAETVLDKKMFRESVISRRCVVPSTGFYEWGKAESGQQSLFETTPVAKNGKTKYLFRLPGQSVLYMAGFHNSFCGVDGQPMERFVILTTAANVSIEDIHDRMPVVLRQEECVQWLEDANFEKLFDRQNISLDRKAV